MAGIRGGDKKECVHHVETNTTWVARLLLSPGTWGGAAYHVHEWVVIFVAALKARVSIHAHIEVQFLDFRNLKTCTQC